MRKDDFELMPSNIRDKLVAYLESEQAKAEKTSAEAALVFTHTLDEKQRSISLAEQGKISILNRLLHLIK